MLILVPAVCACGGNVVVDAASKTGAGGAGAGGSATVGAATGGVATFGSSSSGPADGPVSSSSSGAVTVTSSSSVSATSSTSSSTSSTGGPVGACTDAPDQAALAAHHATFDQDLFNCTISNLGSPGGSAMCLVGKEGLSWPCADCFATEGQCGAMACENVCSGGVGSPPCLACLDSHCNAAFTSCSGIPFPG